jgi:hypothetical protein
MTVPDLIVLAVGLSLGISCCAVLLKARATEKSAVDAAKHAASAMLVADQQLKLIKDLTDRQQNHDHEIAALYDKAGMRRP